MAAGAVAAGVEAWANVTVANRGRSGRQQASSFGVSSGKGDDSLRRPPRVDDEGEYPPEDDDLREGRIAKLTYLTFAVRRRATPVLIAFITS